MIVSAPDVVQEDSPTMIVTNDEEELSLKRKIAGTHWNYVLHNDIKLLSETAI